MPRNLAEKGKKREREEKKRREKERKERREECVKRKKGKKGKRKEMKKKKRKREAGKRRAALNSTLSHGRVLALLTRASSRCAATTAIKAPVASFCHTARRFEST